MTLPAVPSRNECLERLRKIFPREAGFDAAASSPIAAAAVFVMLFVGAVREPGPVVGPLVRPSTVLWMSDGAARMSDDETARRSWFEATRSQPAIEAWHTEHGEAWQAWYADTSREPLRDETFRVWSQHGALYRDESVPTTSSSGRYALTGEFAALFDPASEGDALDAAVEAWQNAHLQPGARVRLHAARERAAVATSIAVRLPNGTVRQLAPGEASLVMRGVVEEWAPRRLADPVVLALSEPRTKLPLVDREVLRTLGVAIDVTSVLPDGVIADIGADPVAFWLVEVVATDGPVSEERRKNLEEWAAGNGIDPGQCRFLSAFTSRAAAPARKRLKDLAVGSYAWFADEPLHELAWYEVGDSGRQ